MSSTAVGGIFQGNRTVSPTGPALSRFRVGTVEGMPASEPSSPIEVQLLPPTARSDNAAIARITALVNEVYATAEDGLWRDGADRTDAREMAALVGAGQIAVARLAGEIVGSVKVQRLDAATGEFGVLAADPAHRGIGIGRELVRFAERTCRADGAVVMQLELLVPRTWSHPSKQRLDGWYTRLGYRPVRSGTAEETHPTLAPLLATPCDFVTYQKVLTS